MVSQITLLDSRHLDQWTELIVSVYEAVLFGVYERRSCQNRLLHNVAFFILRFQDGVRQRICEEEIHSVVAVSVTRF